jgi:very-short-patch-repair endonuclease
MGNKDSNMKEKSQVELTSEEIARETEDDQLKNKSTDSHNDNNSNFSFQSLESVRKQLLDLSNRNPLLNYRYPKVGCVRLIDELPDQIFEILNENKALSFIPVLEPKENELIKYGYIKIDNDTNEIIELKELPKIEVWAKLRYDLETSYELPAHSGKSKETELQTLLYPPNLESRLRNLLRNSETAIQDSGTNILYLTLGFLEWYESNDSSIKHLAPLFTIPVQLEKNKFDKGLGVYYYNVILKDDSLFTNITLKEKLYNDFNLNLPEIEDETKPEEYFKMVSNSILANKPGWRIRRQASLIKLNFRKQVMYQDLNPKKWPQSKSLDKHSILKMFFGESEGKYGPEANGFEEEHNIDSIEDIHDNFPIVFDADSSQHSALIDAVKGKNLVIEGPPGTGKSQTIANLIAAELSNGKKVLFVTDKMPALEVVKKRLDIKGLGDSCLELHSHKTNKQAMLDDLMSRLKKLQNIPHPSEITTEINRFEYLKLKLNNYAKIINSKYLQTGESVHTILNKATRLREKLDINPDKLSIDGISGDQITDVTRNDLISKAKLLKTAFEKVAEQAKDNVISNHYWCGINDSEINEYQTETLNNSLKKWTEKLTELKQHWGYLVDELELGIDPNHKTESISEICEAIAKLPEPNGHEAFSEIEYLILSLNEFERFIQTYEEIHGRNNELCKIFKSQSVNHSEIIFNVSNITKILNKIGVNSDVEISDLVQVNGIIDGSISLANQIETEFVTISNNVPKAIKESINVTQAGLLESEILFGFVNQLPFELWNQRNDELYDNPDLDIILPKYLKVLNIINPLQKILHEYFRLHKIPELDKLLIAQTSIESAGLLPWFSSDWRKAMKLLRSLSVKPKLNKKILINLLPDLIEYTRGVSKLDILNHGNPVFGELYRGVDTPIEEICVPLRNWYKSIREEYGFGFGDRVAIGDEIIHLDRNIAMRISEIVNQGLGSKINIIKENISNIRVIIPNYAVINDPSIRLSGDESPFIKLNKSLGEKTQYFSQILQTSEVSLGTIEQYQKLLVEVDAMIENWEKSSIHKKLVPEIFGFSPLAGTKDDLLLAGAKNTLCIFSISESVPPILNALSSKPDSTRYQSLIKCHANIKKLVEEENITKADFINEGKVNYLEWSESSSNKIGSLIQKNQLALNNPLWLGTWIQYIDLKKKLSHDGFGEILKSMEDKNFKIDQLIDLVDLVFYQQLSKEILSNHETIREFNGLEQTGLIEQFKECDRNLMELQCKNISYSATRKRPPTGISTGKIKNYTELSLILHEAGLKRKQTSVRGLIKRAGRAILSLKPCFMMSPMSVAQYLIPGKFEFDLIVMDEASQIRPEDALGSIARGSQLVVVGDPKQLPPTSFFTKLVDDDGQDEDTVSLQVTDSILDTVIPMFDNRRLRWHYRSRHESLIAFSNKNFYDSDLVIFPSPFQQNKKYGVKFTSVKGRFVNRRNRFEAAEIARKATSHMLQHPDESVGIVAMNSEQRDEILMQLEQIIKDNQLLRSAYEKNQNLEEPLFIKNLENVQGDERDVIMISMTYGPEEVGKRTMQRFGPINTDVGWRRLNVLFTRAKNRMHIFSSMGHSDIQINKDSKRGVVALKAFLDYCENGNLQQSVHTGKPPDSDFEIAVMSALEKVGYVCEPQLGVAGYFLDLAVKDPNKPGRFLVGIECDGATYHSAKSARDRDRLRQDVLEQLGWEIHRIWSTDWFKNPQAQLEPIIKRLEKLKLKFAEDDDLGREDGKEVDLFPEAEFADQISFFDKEPVTVKKAYDKSSLKQGSAVELSSNSELLIEEEQSNDEKLRLELERFDKEEIKPKFPNTSNEQRLLRPKMLSEIVRHKPTTRDEFLVQIPQYLRQSTLGSENKAFIDSVLDIVSEFE